MAPNLLGKSTIFISSEPGSNEPVQIIGKAEPAHDVTPVHSSQARKEAPKYRWRIVWRNVLGFIYLHIVAVYGLYQFLFVCQWKTTLFTLFTTVLGAQGITAGAHRLWAHKSYKAKLPLRILLGFCQTLAFQNHIYEWVRDHRVHHKFTDTDADPHNAQRGFFFSHMGWLLVKKHKDVFVRGKTVDLSDLEEDVVVRFQRKYYLILMPICCFVLPTSIPWYFWNETASVCWNVCVARYVISLHGTWLVNSAAHIWGMKPYDKNIGPTENRTVAFWAFGEGWHNYHHVFPWDYKAAELAYKLNPTTAIIDMFAKIGWAYDLKTVSLEMINKRARRTGDGTRQDIAELTESSIASAFPDHPHDEKEMIWGWGDKDMPEEDIKDATHYNKSD